MLREMFEGWMEQAGELAGVAVLVSRRVPERFEQEAASNYHWNSPTSSSLLPGSSWKDQKALEARIKNLLDKVAQLLSGGNLGLLDL